MTDREAFAEPSGQRFSEMASKKKVSCIAAASHCRGEPPAA
jgi:hypothetical protein